MSGVRDFPMPDLGEGLTEGEIVRWLVTVGERVAVDQPVAEISTEKAVVEVPSPYAGVVVTLHGGPGDVVPVGRPLISVDTAAGSAEADSVRTTSAAAAPVEVAESGNVLVGYGTSETGHRRRRAGAPANAAVGTPAPAPAAPAPRVATPASPLVRRLAAELGVDLTTVSGTGPGGTVSRADLERAVERGAVTGAAAPAAEAPAERIRLAGPRRITAERLTQSHRDAPAAGAWLTADATALLELRRVLAARHPDGRVTPLALILRLCVAALHRFPLLNAHFDSAAGEIVVARAVHLGVAVQAPHGLLVPVIRDAGARSAVAIAAELSRLTDAARDGSIAAAELSGSTFTVSNFGAFGVDGGTPIINPPEAAILGVGRIAERPWVVDGAVVARRVVELSLVFDHRVCDGGVAGGFLRLLGDLVEHPALAIAED
ncbi:MAG TPA: dihydrolipoamide acetyltransferase family protein [Candidatus Dormibacteraeota bacterium]